MQNYFNYLNSIWSDFSACLDGLPILFVNKSNSLHQYLAKGTTKFILKVNSSSPVKRDFNVSYSDTILKEVAQLGSISMF